MQPRVRADSGSQRPERLNRNLHCTGCRYNLRGLLRSGKCPECGAAIADSLPIPLEADPHYIRELKEGVELMLVGWYSLPLAPFTCGLSLLFTIGTLLTGAVAVTNNSPRLSLPPKANRHRRRTQWSLLVVCTFPFTVMLALQAGIVALAVGVLQCFALVLTLHESLRHLAAVADAVLDPITADRLRRAAVASLLLLPISVMFAMGGASMLWTSSRNTEVTLQALFVAGAVAMTLACVIVIPSALHRFRRGLLRVVVERQPNRSGR